MAIDPIAALTIRPASAELKPGETQTFAALNDQGKPVPNVKWTLVGQGKQPKELAGGTYVAPQHVYRARKLSVLAQVQQKDAVSDPGPVIAMGNAVVELDPAPSWVPWLGGFWVVLFGVLLWILSARWTALCFQCSPPGLLVSPPVVTLTRGQAQQFMANASAVWTNTVNSAGLYVAPTSIDSEQMVTVTATSTSDPKQSATGVVRQSPAGGLVVLPARVTVNPGKQVQLTAASTGGIAIAPTWLPPSAGTISSTGLYTAPNDTRPQVVTVLAQAQAPASGSAPLATFLAGALVSVVPATPDPCDLPVASLWRVLMLVALVGAIGGLTHAMGSFATYVGNRELKASWLWWYALRPTLSAAVAVLVFLVFRAGLGAPDIGLAAGDCLKIAGFAGLVGLFAEPATVKLKDIFEAIFTPRSDPREDKAGEDKPVRDKEGHDKAAQDKAAKDEAAQDEVVQDEVVQDKAAQDKTT